MNYPELLAPAGNLEKLKLAILYGADAVYLGGKSFSLRSAADNFSEEEIIEALEFVHSRGKKAYIVLNSFLHDREIENLPPFVRFLESAGIDGVIASDLGVVSVVKKHSSLPLHLSTQASCLNSEAAMFWRDQGVKRVVLGREVSLEDAHNIKAKSGLEIEMFIHGAMCMSYSGHCVMSTYTHERDSNRGGCAHNCRFFYELENDQGEKKRAFFYSSKDLMGLPLLEDFVKAGVDSLKIEGRMKGHHYVGTIIKAYAQTLRLLKTQGHLSEEQKNAAVAELSKIAHREYTYGGLLGPAGADSVYEGRENDKGGHEVCGVVLEVQGEHMLVEVKAPFEVGSSMELVPFVEENVIFPCPEMFSISGETVSRTKPGSLIRMKRIDRAEKFNFLRRRLGV